MALQNAEAAFKSSKAIDGGKPLFKVVVKLDSTIVSDNAFVQRFLMNSHFHLYPKTSPSESGTDSAILAGS